METLWHRAPVTVCAQILPQSGLRQNLRTQIYGSSNLPQSGLGQNFRTQTHGSLMAQSSHSSVCANFASMVPESLLSSWSHREPPSRLTGYGCDLTRLGHKTTQIFEG